MKLVGTGYIAYVMRYMWSITGTESSQSSPYRYINLISRCHWVQVLKDETGMSMVSIYIDTTTSTCWGSKCLWSQLLSFLLNLWAPLVVIGTCETQGLRETMTLLRGLLGGCKGQALGDSRTKNVTFSPVGHAWQPKWLRPMTAKRANNQGENVHIYLILLHRLC